MAIVTVTEILSIPQLNNCIDSALVISLSDSIQVVLHFSILGQRH